MHLGKVIKKALSIFYEHETIYVKIRPYTVENVIL